jgi:ABC-type ATPase involved in cell division
VLLESLTVAANLALPLTVSIDPMSDVLRARVVAEGREAGLSEAVVSGPAGALSRTDRLRVHLARAVINRPQFVLLEDPTRGLDDRVASRAFGDTLRAVSADRAFGWIAISEDDDFAKASRGKRLTVDDRGRVTPTRGWRPWPW